MAVGFPTKVDYNTGDVLSAQNMNDLSGTVNLLDGTQSAAGKNSIINSAMQVWQRGTTALAAATSAATGFTADRWQLYRASFTANCTGSRQLTADTVNLPNIQYGLRIQRTAGDTSTNFVRLVQTFETVNSIPLAGKTVTLSFYAKKGANYSPTNGALSVNVDYGTGTDQNYITGFTGNTNISATLPILTTTYQRFTASFTVPAAATQLATYFAFTPTGTAGANDWFEITGVQLEASTVASAFSTNGATVQAELSACQRYYYRAVADTTSQNFGAGQCFTITGGRVVVSYPVTMRTRPTSLEQSGTAADYQVRNIAGTGVALSVVPTYTALTTAQVAEVLFTVASGLVAGNATILFSANTSAYLGWSAEL